MPKTIQIRDVDDEVYAGLKLRALEAGLSVPELLRGEAARIAARPSMATWLDELARSPSAARGGRGAAVADLDELRGPWPDDAGR